jgi:hypothetical protein
LGIFQANVKLISWVVSIGCGYELFIGKTQCRVCKVGGVHAGRVPVVGCAAVGSWQPTAL